MNGRKQVRKKRRMDEWMDGRNKEGKGGRMNGRNIGGKEEGWKRGR